MKKILLIILFLPLFIQAQISVVKSNFQAINTFMQYSNQLFFYASDGTNQGLWKTDGTTTGTLFVKALMPIDISNGQEYVISGGLLYFNSGGVIWRTDGTTNGTFSLNVGYSSPLFKIDLNGLLVFIAEDADGQELWRSDGTLVGTYKITDFYTGSISGVIPRNMAKQGDYIYFGGQPNASFNGTLCRTDGTVGGTQVIANAGRGISDLAEINGKIIFSSLLDYTVICVGYENQINSARRIMKVEGGICSILKNPPTFYSGDYPNSYCTVFGGDFSESYFFRKSGNKLFFGGLNYLNPGISNITTDALWVTDGSNTEKLKVFLGNSFTYNNTALESFYFAGGNSIDNTFFDGIFYFPAGDDNTGYEVWRSDGTIAGTFVLKDIRVGSVSSEPLDFRTVNGITYFTAHDGIKRKLFKTDGTTIGTIEVPDPNVILNLPSSTGQLNTPSNQKNLWSNVIGNKFLFAGTTTDDSGAALFIVSPPPCETTVTLQSTTDDYSNTSSAPNGVLVKQAFATNGSIIATNKITSTAKVTYQAKSISLDNGFKADNGTVFKAEIGGCSN